MFGRNRAIRELREVQQAGRELLQMHPDLPLPTEPAPSSPAPTSTASSSAAEADDFLPPDLRVPSRDEIAGMMMRYDTPLVIDGEVRACPQCGAYREWVLLSVRDQVWLRCRAGHETLEPRLDAAWYNRTSGPMDRWHPTLDEGLKHLGH
ncbi:hypothetical protein [Streptomyces luteireticuli]|uniref:hypothetical protein n=1 Tax=Streptomyces luteireticuli TaxID=173858 RepID=UPI00355857FF